MILILTMLAVSQGLMSVLKERRLLKGDGKLCSVERCLFFANSRSSDNYRFSVLNTRPLDWFRLRCFEVFEIFSKRVPITLYGLCRV